MPHVMTYIGLVLLQKLFAWTIYCIRFEIVDISSPRQAVSANMSIAFYSNLTR